MDAPTKSKLRLTRGHRLGAIVVALVALVSAALSPTPASADSEAAKSADSFVESIGVDTHTSYSDTPYGEDFATVKQRLAELGVRHIREDLLPKRPDQYEHFDELAAIGIRSTLILGDPSNGDTGLEELVSIVKNDLGGSVEAVEGPNEFDSRGGPEWASQLRDYQQRLYAAVKSDPSLATLPVIGPSVVQKRNEETLGDISGSLDYGNVHSYPDAAAPESNVASYLERASLNAGSKPTIATETGYHTAVATGDEHQPVSEAAMATYMPRLFLEYFRSGIARTYCYELLDESPDPGHTDSEANFGLLHNDLSPKPAFTALANLIAILRDPGPAFSPAPVDYTLGGNQDGLRQVLLQKRDGSFYLALWRAESVWDPASRTDLHPAPAPVSLELERTVKSAQTYMPNASAQPVSAPTAPAAGRPLTVQVGPQVTIVRLELGARAPSRITVQVSKHSVPAGGKLAVTGRLLNHASARSVRVRIQSWAPSKRHWRTVGNSRTSRRGAFRKKIRLTPASSGHVSRLRVIARTAKPSRPVRVRVRS